MDKKPFNVMFDPGHGGRQPGAVFQEGGVVVKEKDVNQQIIKHARVYLFEHYHDSISTYLTRLENRTMSLEDRCRKTKCITDYISTDEDEFIEMDLFISVHCNSFDEVDDEEEGVTGIETFYYYDDGKQFANVVQRNLMTNFPGRKNRGIKRGKFYVLKHSIPEAVLVECEFLDELGLWLNQESIQQQFGLAIGEAIREYFLC